MVKRIYFMLACFVLVACKPSPDQLTSTFVVAQIQTQTAAPTLTSTITSSPTSTTTPTLTPTPTITPSPTPTPTPLGGHQGRLIFGCGFSLCSLSSVGYGSGIEETISRAQLLKTLSLKSTPQDYLIAPSPDGEKIFIWALESAYCSDKERVYLVTSDLKNVKSMDVGFSVFFEIYDQSPWSPNSSKVLIQGRPCGGGRYWKTSIISASEDGFGKRVNLSALIYSAFWSADGSRIYLSQDAGFSSVNDTGADKRILKCAIDYCISYAFAQSSDGKKVAFGHGEQVIIADADFSNPIVVSDKLVGRHRE